MYMIVSEKIDAFMAKYGVRPEKIIMNENDYKRLLEDFNKLMPLDDKKSELKTFKVAVIEVDKNTTVLILKRRKSDE